MELWFVGGEDKTFSQQCDRRVNASITELPVGQADARLPPSRFDFERRAVDGASVLIGQLPGQGRIRGYRFRISRISAMFAGWPSRSALGT